MTMLSLALLLGLSDEISSTTVAPAGNTTPFDPGTSWDKEAVNRSPMLFVLVHTCCPDVSAKLVPAGIVPTCPSEFPVEDVTVFPDGVVEDEAAGGGEDGSDDA